MELVAAETNSVFDVNSTDILFNKLDDILRAVIKSPISEVPQHIKTKLHHLYFTLKDIFLFTQSYQNEIILENGIDSSLWMDNILYRYIYEECINYVNNKSTGCMELYCSVCDELIKNNSTCLFEHLNLQSHITSFEKFKNEQDKILWKGFQPYKWAFEKFIEIRNDMTNKQKIVTIYCHLCDALITISKISPGKNLHTHLSGSKHMNMFKKMNNAKLNLDNFTGRIKNVDKSQKNNDKDVSDSESKTNTKLESQFKQDLQVTDLPTMMRKLAFESFYSDSNSQVNPKSQVSTPTKSSSEKNADLFTLFGCDPNYTVVSKESIEKSSSVKKKRQPKLSVESSSSCGNNVIGGDSFEGEENMISLSKKMKKSKCDINRSSNESKKSISKTVFTYFNPYSPNNDTVPPNKGKKKANILKTSPNHSSNISGVHPEKKTQKSTIDVNDSPTLKNKTVFSYFDPNSPNSGEKSPCKETVCNQKEIKVSRVKTKRDKEKLKGMKKSSSVKTKSFNQTIDNHNVFMKILKSKKSDGSKFLCEPCGFHNASDDVTEIFDEHMNSIKHKHFVELKTNLAFMNYCTLDCEFCSVKLFCTTNLIEYHNNSKSHKINASNLIENNSDQTNKADKSNQSLTINKKMETQSLKEDTGLFNKELKILLKRLLVEFDEKLVKKEHLGFFCSACNYWCLKSSKWNKHLLSKDHLENLEFEGILNTYSCDCGILLICDADFYSIHESYFTHKNLKSFITQKSLIFNEKSSTQSENILLPKSVYRKGISFKIKEYSESITKDDLISLFSNQGDVEFIDILEPCSAVICITLKSDLKELYPIDNLNGSPCVIDSLCEYNLCNNILNNFSANNKAALFKLLFDPADEYMVKTKIIEGDLYKICENVTMISNYIFANDYELIEFALKKENLSPNFDLRTFINGISSLVDSGQLSEFQTVEIVDNDLIILHKTTNFRCRIFYDSGPKYQAVKLLNFYINSDERIRKMLIILKYCVSGIGLLDKCITSYTLAWLALYFLMTPSADFLQPVEFLRKSNLAGNANWFRDTRFFIYDENSCIPEHYNGKDLLKRDPKLDDVDDLIKGFFLFYATGINTEYVLCPLMGGSMPKDQINEQQYLKDSSFNITEGLCLQDPCIFDKNLTEELKGLNLFEFKEFCKKMTILLHQ